MSELKMQRAAMWATLILLVTGCSVLSVHRDKAEKTEGVKGIPFYLKTRQTHQETTYLEPKYSVEVSRLDNSAKTTGESKITKTTLYRVLISASRVHSDAMKELREALEAGNPTMIHQSVNKLLSEDPCKSAAIPSFKPPCFQLIGNTLASEMIVDTSQTYYLNARHPIIGKGAVEFELSDEMTLAKGKAEVEEKTAETILGMIPLADYLSARYIPEESEAEAADKSGDFISEYVLEIAPTGVVHQLSRKADTLASPLTEIESGTAYVSSQAPSASGAAKVSGYAIEGTIKPASSQKKE